MNEFWTAVHALRYVIGIVGLLLIIGIILTTPKGKS